MNEETKTSYTEKQEVLRWIEGIDDVRNIVVIRYETQTFGWPAGESEYFTKERGRSLAFVSQVIDETPDAHMKGFGIKRQIFSTKEELMALIEATTESPFWDIVEISGLSTLKFQEAVLPWDRAVYGIVRYANGRYS
jgi:hypothetical protein